MKKIIMILTIIVLSLSVLKKELIKEDSMIRFRIIANSNEEKDQQLKKKVLHSISDELLGFKGVTKEEEKDYIISMIPTINNSIKDVIEEKEQYDISYGNHFFPEKEYEGKIYPEGEYESLVITLGSGKGDNFWCILFPPLCMIEDEDIEYKSFIKEALEKLF